MKNPVLNYIAVLTLGIVLGVVANKYFITSSFSDGIPEEIKATKISPGDASRMINDYHDQPANRKLQVRTSAGNEFVETFLVDENAISALRALGGNSFCGIGLSLALNSDSHTTLIVSALVKENGSGSFKHLIPAPSAPNPSDYFYDHLNICPNVCPSNHLEIRRMP